jgi:heptosyltransferase-1
MGDVLHALPAVASLKLSFPQTKLSWIISPKWVPLLEGNPLIDQIILLRRGEGWSALAGSMRQIRNIRPDLAIDFQGLVQSAVAGRIARPRSFLGLDRSIAREPLASFFYSHKHKPTGAHRIERNLDLAKAAGATTLTGETWLPQGRPEGELPNGPFVLASPFAGWASKQWPLEHYRELSTLLENEGVPLVLNVAAAQAASLTDFSLHTSSLSGLIDATRRAAAVVGVDSGPLHLSAALGKSGVAIFGPTDPAGTGPYGGAIRVLRHPDVATTYRRENEIHPAMRAISAREVFEQLLPQLRSQPVVSGRAL